MAKNTIAKAVVTQVAKEEKSMSKSIKGSVNTSYVPCRVLSHSYILDNGQVIDGPDSHDTVVGIELVVRNQGVLASNPFCMASNVSDQCVRLTGYDYTRLINFWLDGIHRGYVEAGSNFDEWLSEKEEKAGTIGIKSDFLR